MEAEVIHIFMTNTYMCVLKIAYIVIVEYQTASVLTSAAFRFWDFGTEAAEVNFETSLQWG